MNFKEKMKEKFLEVLNGTVEPTEWEIWWNDNIDNLEKNINSHILLDIMPINYDYIEGYARMVDIQKNVALFFYKDERPYKNISDYYKIKAEQVALEKYRKLLDDFHKTTMLEREAWESYLKSRPTKDIDFDWKNLLETPSLQKPPMEFDYKKPSTTEQYKECSAELKLRLKENMKEKITPLAKAYGFKKSGVNTFVKEQNGLIWSIKFRGYFRGGGYEALECYICPTYALPEGSLSIPSYITCGEAWEKVMRNWSVIQYDLTAIDCEVVTQINQKFDDILEYLATKLLPEWQKIDSLECYFSKERIDYLKATEVGPINPHTNRPMWQEEALNENHPWRAEHYFFGVWHLLCGEEEEGYNHLEECVLHYENPDSYAIDFTDYNNKRNHLSVLYYNAKLFYETKEISDMDERRQEITRIYEDVCKYMLYYHGLSKPIKR